MNHIAFNAAISSCGNSLYSINLKNIYPGGRAVLIARIVASALSCPLSTLLNILVMIAVKAKPQLRTKSNIALACLSTTDLMVGLVIQPLHITATSLFLKGERMFCTITDISKTTTFICILASLYHLVSMSTERYVGLNTRSHTGP